MPRLHEALDLTAEDIDIMLKAITRYSLTMGGGVLCIDDKSGRPWFAINNQQMNALGCELHRVLHNSITQSEEGRLRVMWHSASRK